MELLGTKEKVVGEFLIYIQKIFGLSNQWIFGDLKI